MSLLNRNRRLAGTTSDPWNAESDVNPMESVSNLADVMLVLAVGMMLALVVAWNVDITLSSPGEADASAYEAIEVEEELTPEDLTPAEIAEGNSTAAGDGSGLTEYGRVYVDESGNYYVIED